MAITYIQRPKRLKKRGGCIIPVDFDSGQFKRRVNFHFGRENPATPEIQAKIDKSVISLRFDNNPLNNLEIDGIDDPAELLATLVVYIRANTGATKVQAKNELDSEHPNMNWKPMAFIDRLIKKLRKRNVNNFNEFKTFLINKKFTGVDD